MSNRSVIGLYVELTTALVTIFSYHDPIDGTKFEDMRTSSRYTLIVMALAA